MGEQFTEKRNNRTKMITFRCTDSEYETISSLQKELGLKNRSEVLRHALDQFMAKRVQSGRAHRPTR